MNKLFSLEKVDNITIIDLIFDKITVEEREQLKNDLKKIETREKSEFIIDLSRVKFVSSLVIAIIVFFTKNARAFNGEVKLSGLSKEAYSVFKITRLDKIFEIYETRDAAIESYKK